MNKILIAACALSMMSPVFASEDIQQREQAAMKASKVLINSLGNVMKKKMKEHGPVETIKVCRDLAPSITGRISNATGWKMTRVSQRHRNSLLGMPDDWEKSVLAKFEQRKQAGEDLITMKYSEVVTDAAGDKYFRFMKALPMKQPCLSCHGSKDNISEPVQAKIKALYPMDAATGFQLGDLRGAISIKQPMKLPLVEEGIGWD